MADTCTPTRRWTVRASKEDEDGGNPWVQLAPEGSYGAAEDPPQPGEVLVPEQS
jgi:hypothetical protein